MNYYLEKEQSKKAFLKKRIEIQNNKIIFYGDVNEILKDKKRKIIKIIRKLNIEQVILSEKIEENLELINFLHSQDIKIIDGKKMMKFLSKEIVEHILQTRRIKKEEIKIAIVSNELSDVIIENIKSFAKEFKSITVVTNHYKKLINTEKELYNTFGIPLIITNNKKRALEKQDIILNYDFIEDSINKYSINSNAIIINFEEKIYIHSKRFNGTNIFDYEINYKDEKIINNKSRLKKEIEAEINFNTPVDNIRKKIQEKNIIIDKLICNSGNII